MITKQAEVALVLRNSWQSIKVIYNVMVTVSMMVLNAESETKAVPIKPSVLSANYIKIESQARNKQLSPQARYQLRQEKAIKEGYILRAIHYILNQWHKLSRCVDDGHLSIDNNITERYIRPFTTGRKNW
jgi:hypothetical protein